MKHLGTINLETERLILRKFKIEDAENMYNNWAGDSEVTKYLYIIYLNHRITDFCILKTKNINTGVNNTNERNYF